VQELKNSYRPSVRAEKTATALVPERKNSPFGNLLSLLPILCFWIKIVKKVFFPQKLPKLRGGLIHEGVLYTLKYGNFFPVQKVYYTKNDPSLPFLGTILKM
jgi:hypothetical protein